MEVLQKYTRDKTLKELQGEVEKARSDMLAKKATYTLEKDKEKKLRDMIKRCTLRAPRDGLIVYANETNSFRGNNQPLIEEGATVRERQKIFSLPDINNMQVNVKVHESMIDQVTKDLPARIRVDAAPNEPISGKVDNVAPLPDPSSFFSSDIKVYTTLVKIDKGLPALRPGMSAEVEILVKQLPNVLSVPVQAILEFKGQQHAWVIGPNGAATRRVVRVGRSNTKTIEILEGLAEGEQVALNPRGLMTEQEKQDSFGSAVQGATQGKTWTGAEAGASGAAGNAAGPDGAAGAAKGKAKGKGARGKRAGGAGGGAGGMMDPAALEKFRQLGPDEQRKQLEARGMPPEMIDPVLQRIKSGGGLGGPPGGGPGGGFGGGPQGGGPVQ
jgi:RND family efflux transporter MFP subunit